MKELRSAALGVAAGALAMFLLDPRSGARRRAFARDKLVKYSHLVRRAFRGRVKDASQRARGQVLRFRSRRASRDLTDDVIEDRIRSRLGRLISHPRAITVQSNDGHIRLCGALPFEEIDPLLEAILAMPEVRTVDSQLEIALRQSS